MKAISLWQPWATLIAIGAKTIETRGWASDYRGPLAIHAAKKWGGDHERLLSAEPFRSILAAAGIHRGADLPKGCVVCTCRLVGMERTETIEKRISSAELQFGNYAYGRWAWRLADVVRLSTPLAWSGSQGFFEVPDVFPSPAAPVVVTSATADVPGQMGLFGPLFGDDKPSGRWS